MGLFDRNTVGVRTNGPFQNTLYSIDFHTSSSCSSTILGNYCAKQQYYMLPSSQTQSPFPQLLSVINLTMPKPKSRSERKTPEETRTAILRAMAELQTIFGIEDCSKSFVVSFVGYGHENSKGFSKALSQLRAENIVETSTKAGCIRFTEKGRRLIPTDVNPPKDNASMQERLLNALRTKVTAQASLESMWKILSDGKAHRIDDLVVAVGYKHANSKGFSKPKAVLKNFGLLEDAGPGVIQFTEAVFPFGRPE